MNFAERAKMFQERQAHLAEMTRAVEAVEWARKRLADALAVIALLVLWQLYGISAGLVACVAGGWLILRFVGNRVVYWWSGKLLAALDILHPMPPKEP